MIPQTQKQSVHKLSWVRTLTAAPTRGIKVQASGEWSPPDLSTQLIPAVSVFTESLLDVKCHSKHLALLVLERTLGKRSCRKTVE